MRNQEALLIILRGNSGSGKTSSAKTLQKRLGHGTMLISQDVVRREILYVKDGPDSATSQLLFELCLYGKLHCEITILEGILDSTWYHKLFERLQKEFGNNLLAYYFDIPFEETLCRHQHKPNAHEFGEKEMRSWWVEKDYLRMIPEKTIQEHLSPEDILSMISQDIQIKFS